jgi:hypothetical protein
MIACLGWGSLIWDPRKLPIDGNWHADGPQLSVEFTRVSRDGRLTLVVTPGALPVTIFWSHLLVPSLDDGIEALAEREGIPSASISNSIGVWSAVRCSRHAQTATVGEWARVRGLTAVVWTALMPGREGSRGTPLTCQQALDHLRRLEGINRARAEEYVRRVPAEVRTPYRAAIERELGWTAI